jgi:hypothetical protein
MTYAMPISFGYPQSYPTRDGNGDLPTRDHDLPKAMLARLGSEVKDCVQDEISAGAKAKVKELIEKHLRYEPLNLHKAVDAARVPRRKPKPRLSRASQIPALKAVRSPLIA